MDASDYGTIPDEMRKDIGNQDSEKKGLGICISFQSQANPAEVLGVSYQSLSSFEESDCNSLLRFPCSTWEDTRLPPHFQISL